MPDELNVACITACSRMSKIEGSPKKMDESYFILNAIIRS